MNNLIASSTIKDTGGAPPRPTRVGLRPTQPPPKSVGREGELVNEGC